MRRIAESIIAQIDKVDAVVEEALVIRRKYKRNIRENAYAVKKLTPNVSKIKKMLKAGATVAEIGKVFGVCRNTMSWFLNNILHGWKMRDRGWIFLSDNEAKVRESATLDASIEAGYSPLSIAKDLGVGEDDVIRVMDLMDMGYNESLRQWEKI